MTGAGASLPSGTQDNGALVANSFSGGVNRSRCRSCDAANPQHRCAKDGHSLEIGIAGTIKLVLQVIWVDKLFSPYFGLGAE
ncbi:hypothetical protein [Limosilactobacillus oris]|uniref:hypothetical protein n=1 Tax=Limosilactobacillus oris TaxID=1632 RepID=UPI0022361EA9|nr:hypothetical protein [Limosilactobacillus oris]MCW4387886.1 hypothetical protein [Limosilactobacillus oris]